MAFRFAAFVTVAALLLQPSHLKARERPDCGEEIRPSETGVTIPFTLENNTGLIWRLSEVFADGGREGYMDILPAQTLRFEVDAGAVFAVESVDGTYCRGYLTMHGMKEPYRVLMGAAGPPGVLVPK